MNTDPAAHELAHLKVLDLGTLIGGPFAATILGDLGADVIKCEQPGTGDPLRHAVGLSSTWPYEARNKRSITLNLRVPEGQDLASRLATWADVIIQTFRPGTLDPWRHGHYYLSMLTARLVY